tara:strand:- start:352 stop:897 length:546 start_codon:yes stop_codon:yes gene_type:complete
MINGPTKNYSGTIIRTTIGPYFVTGLLIVIILLVDLAIPLGVAGGVPYIAAVLLSLWVPHKRFTILVSIICSMLTIAGFFWSPTGGEMWKVISNRGLALFAIWVTAFLALQRRMLDEKILHGFLPICASCKKIRDDKGYWNQIESYIKEHSEVNFSHGVCPDCARKLYPEIFKDKEPESNT